MIDQLAAMASVIKVSTFTAVTEVIQSTATSMQGIQIPTSAHVMNAMDVLGQVHAFYDNAWNNLIWFFSLAGIFIGIIMPLLISYIQSKTIKSTEETIKFQISEQNKVLDNQRTAMQKQKAEFEKKFEIQKEDFENRISEQEKDFKNQLEKQDKDFNEQIQKQESKFDKTINETEIGLRAIMSYAQAYSQEKDNPCFALGFGSTSVLLFHKINDIGNMAKVLNFMVRIIKEYDFESIQFKDEQDTIKKMLRILAKIDVEEKQKLADNIASIQKFYNKILIDLEQEQLKQKD